MANYPATGPQGRCGSTGRKQRKFVDKEKAELFLARQKKQYEERWNWKYWSDTRVRNDVIKALSLISGIAGATLTAAARVYVECRSAQEFRRGTGEEGEKRSLELSARLGSGLGRLAARRGISIEDLVAGILWGFIEKESQACEEENRAEGWRFWRLG